jgi:predicted transposase YdaD
MTSLNLKKPHDAFFKQLMSNPKVLKHFLNCFLPKDLKKHFNLGTIQILSPEKINRKYKYKCYYLDLVISCKLLNNNCEIYLVFEKRKKHLFCISDKEIYV